MAVGSVVEQFAPLKNQIAVSGILEPMAVVSLLLKIMVSTLIVAAMLVIYGRIVAWLLA